MRTLFKNGTIIDGTGEKPWVGDVLIEDDRIAEVGENIAVKADKVVDLTGLQICPGLIDAHSHNDFFYDRENAEKYFKPFIEQGITTQITGNCSFSPFGMDENTPFRDKIGGGLFQAEHPGSFAAFKERAKGKLFVNLVPLIGQGSVRAGIAGYDPTPLSREIPGTAEPGGLPSLGSHRVGHDRSDLAALSSTYLKCRSTTLN